MHTKHPRRGKALVVIAALTAVGYVTETGPLGLGGDPAEAVIGRPLTPLSYAGVARRTTRRAAYAGAAARPYGYGYGVGVAPAPVVPSTAVVTALPAGCGQVGAAGTVYYQCGPARYQPYYSGATLVYRPF